METVVHQNPWFRVTEQSQGDLSWFRIHAADTAVVLATTNNEKILFIRGRRGGGPRESYELPGGIVETGENPEDAAIRECREETGYCVAETQSLGHVLQVPAISSTRCHIFQAKITSRGSSALEPGENWQSELLSVAEVHRLIAAGAIEDAATLSALCRYFSASR
ncbi:NUDIX domain-containing protein [Arthrobacter alpinus]|uniref:NUDIX domain-containing protein n=1 Tax=Arthrobacter alpinus TaxID=656366 RepID=A0A1H5LPZ1_9MICC|nr:NUDIX hydrolase [Arthrobacter alpinus]SEE78587.1 NUDIX domain-containing protein [Arthrobacter alpinus]